MEKAPRRRNEGDIYSLHEALLLQTGFAQQGGLLRQLNLRQKEANVTETWRISLLFFPELRNVKGVDVKLIGYWIAERTWRSSTLTDSYEGKKGGGKMIKRSQPKKPVI